MFFDIFFFKYWLKLSKFFKQFNFRKCLILIDWFQQTFILKQNSILIGWCSLGKYIILILFYVKSNWLRILDFFFTFLLFLRLFDTSFLKLWDILNLPFFLSLLIEVPSLKRNERVVCLDCGRENTRKDASRHRKHCDVLKCSNCNFYAYSSEELTNHIMKKHCVHNVKLCAQQPPNTLQGKVKLI